MNTLAEENYLKAIYHLSLNSDTVSTNQIAASLNTKAASVTDMLKKLAEKLLINYARYQGVSLTPAGEKVAVNIIRKHRLWEYFLVEKLKFKWDEVHDMAEEMEHISSTELIDRLEKFMGYPVNDPHGDPIPDRNGNFKKNQLISVAELAVDECGVVSGVRNHSTAFLQHLEKLKLVIGKKVKVTDLVEYDRSVVLNVDGNDINISRDVAANLLIAL